MPTFLSFIVDHMTLLVSPEMYNSTYAILRVLFGVPKNGVIYEKRRRWEEGKDEVSMTFAVDLTSSGFQEKAKTIVAVVQPSEPLNQSSHVRKTLADHGTSAHWQHIALRTPDLLKFYKFALERGINFITPIMKDEREDLVQVFSGEWYPPGKPSSGIFFEFVERPFRPSRLAKFKKIERELWFRDKTFLGLYDEKEKEYQSGEVSPFIDHELWARIQDFLRAGQVWEITEEDLRAVERMMLDYAKSKRKKGDKIAV